MRCIRFLLPALLAFQVGVPPALAWAWPVDGPVLQPFTYDRSQPYAAGQHRGIDIGAPTGATVRAPAGGTVTFAGSVPGGGKAVTIQTPDGHSATLVHLGSIAVARSAAVAEGEVVGSVGPSGEPELDQPYVHFGVRLTADEEGYLDPLGFLTGVGPPPPAPETPAAEVPAREEPSARPEQTKRVRTRAASPAPAVTRPALAGARERASGGEHEGRPVSKLTSPAAAPPRRTRLGSFEQTGEPGRRVGAERTLGEPWAAPAWLLACAGVGLLVALGLAARGARGQLRDAELADGAAAMLDELGLAPAEDAAVLGPREQDDVVLDRDLELVLLGQAETLAELDRNDDSAELVDVANDARARRAPKGARRRRPHRCLRSRHARFRRDPLAISSG
jgi:murein DD-endopeptidase MepM/ murein hydrolase activator NlpD